MKKTFMVAAPTAMMLIATFVLAPSAQSAHHDHDAKPMEQSQIHMEQMQAHMKQMQEQMEKIHRTQDPKERQRLLQAHLKSMQQGMQVINSASEDTLEHRVHMMEMMMDQMLKSQEVTTELLPQGFKDKY